MSDYQKLQTVLAHVIAQVADGKGAQRHAIGLPRAFERQPMLEISRMVGPGFQLGQAMKKAQEVYGFFDAKDYDKAKEEIFGAIAYLAGAVILIDEYKEAAKIKAPTEPAKVQPGVSPLQAAMRKADENIG